MVSRIYIYIYIYIYEDLKGKKRWKIEVCWWLSFHPFDWLVFALVRKKRKGEEVRKGKERKKEAIG